MSQHLSRRSFLRVSTFTTLALAGVGGRIAFGQSPAGVQSGGDRPLYAFPVLGDIHYDKLAHHDMDWVKREQAGDIRQIEGYVATTETYTPRLLVEVARAVRESVAPVPFVIQVGDLVEGLCGSFDLQATQFTDCFAAIDAAKLGTPLLMTKGNHDVTGPGASEAFDRVLLPWLSKQAGQELTTASYFVRQHDDLLIFFDGYKPDLDWLQRTLEGNKAKRVFFVCHQPVVPYNARANWIVFGKEQQAADRARLLSLLGTHHAIVLGGHLHKYAMVRRTTEGGGSITQLAVSSVLRNEVERPRDERDGVAAFGADLVAMEPRFSAPTVDRRRQMLADERPAIERFEYADVPGYAMVNVYADRVETDVYVGLSREAWKRRDLATGGPVAPSTRPA